MAEPEFNTMVLQESLNRWQAGDRAAANELFRMVLDRLEKLSSKMLRSFPNVRGLADSDDVLQNSLLRLLRTLRTLRPTTTRDFFNLAAVHIRRELLDLARRARVHPTRTLLPASEEFPLAENFIAPLSDDDDWVRFHEAVDELPVEEREVVGLVFYHGWTQAQIGELFQVNERTIRRRWATACQRLRDLVGANLLDE
jgi:RNA polymerase sigma-70 factor (ECF subfamily)